MDHNDNNSMQGIVRGGHDGFGQGQQNEGAPVNPQNSTQTLEQPILLPIQEMINTNTRLESRLGDVDSRLDQLIREVRYLGSNQSNVVQIEPGQNVSFGSPKFSPKKREQM